MTAELVSPSSSADLRDPQRTAKASTFGKLAKFALYVALLIAPRLPAFSKYTVEMTVLAVAVGWFPLFFRIHRSLLKKTPDWTGALAGAVVVTAAMLPTSARAWVVAHTEIWLPMACIVLFHLFVGSVAGVRAYRAATGPAKLKLEAGLSQIIPPRLATVAAHDVDLLRHLISWHRPADVPQNMTPFSYYRHVRPTFFMFLAIASIEAIAAHFLFMRANPVVRWIVFVIDDVGILYLLAFTLSLSKLPILIGRGGLRVRAGILIDQWIPIEEIASVRQALSLSTEEKGRMLKASLMAYPNTVVTLKRPMSLSLPLRGERSVDLIGLHPDDATGFMKSLNGMIHIRGSAT